MEDINALRVKSDDFGLLLDRRQRNDQARWPACGLSGVPGRSGQRREARDELKRDGDLPVGKALEEPAVRVADRTGVARDVTLVARHMAEQRAHRILVVVVGTRTARGPLRRSEPDEP